jgi:hypothetical protein
LKVKKMLFKDNIKGIELFHQHRDLISIFRKARALA